MATEIKIKHGIKKNQIDSSKWSVQFPGEVKDTSAKWDTQFRKTTGVESPRRDQKVTLANGDQRQVGKMRGNSDSMPLPQHMIESGASFCQTSIVPLNLISNLHLLRF